MKLRYTTPKISWSSKPSILKLLWTVRLWHPIVLLYVHWRRRAYSYTSWCLRFLGFGWWWSRSHECHNDIATPRKIRDEVLAQGVWGGGRACQRPFRSYQHVSFVLLKTFFLNITECPFVFVALLSTQQEQLTLQEERMVSFVYTILTTLTSRQSPTATWRLSTNFVLCYTLAFGNWYKYLERSSLSFLISRRKIFRKLIDDQLINSGASKERALSLFLVRIIHLPRQSLAVVSWKSSNLSFI